MDQHLLRKWKPNIAVTGLEYLKNALNENNGVILLITPFAYSDLIVKMGLFQRATVVDGGRAEGSFYPPGPSTGSGDLSVSTLSGGSCEVASGSINARVLTLRTSGFLNQFVPLVWHFMNDYSH